jgi:biopolymer transport protein ExbD
MVMTMRAGPARAGALSDINVTPMADIMIVLLIIFMVGVPAMRTPPVPLPDARNAHEHREDPIVVVVTAAGRISVGSDLFAGPGALADYVHARSAASSGLPVLVQGDREADYATVARVIEACREAGVSEIGLATRPLPGR